MVSYEKTRIFTIRNRVNDKKFVSYTTNRLCEVFNNYRQQFKRGKTNNALMEAFKEIGIEHFYIVLEEEVNCANKDMVNERVHYHMYMYDTINNGYNYQRAYRKKMTPCEVAEPKESVPEPTSEVDEPKESVPEPTSEVTKPKESVPEPTSEVDEPKESIPEVSEPDPVNTKRYTLPTGIHYTTLQVFDEYSPLIRFDIYRDLIHQLLNKEITVSSEVKDKLTKLCSRLYF